MKPRFALLPLLAALSLWLAAPAIAQADPPPAHQYIQEYKGAETCETCHIGIADEVTHSVHYTWAEKMDHYSPLPGTIPSINWLGVLNAELGIAGGCGRCHIGPGVIPGSPEDDAQARSQVDCLICHSEVYDMGARYPVQDEAGNWTIPGDRSLLAARTAGRPTDDTCLRCHLNAGGEPLGKRGVDFAPVADRHAAESTGDIHADLGVVCADCHRAPDHIFYGFGPTLWSRDRPDARLACADCHGSTPHQGAILNQHQRLDCRTCHVLSTGGLLERDWTAPAVYDPITELYHPLDEVAPTNSVAPDYHWYNGEILREGDSLPGAYGDLNSKIQPFKDFAATVPVDAATETPLPLKLDVYYTSGDLEAAITAGAAAAGINYSGAWQPQTMVVPLQVSHGVVGKERALDCADCHIPEGRVDFALLGYDSKRVEQLQSISIRSGETLPELRVDIPNPEAGSAPSPELATNAPAEVIFIDQLSQWSLWGVALIVLASAILIGWLLLRQRQKLLG